MSAALPAHAAGKPVEVWFQDEARVGQQGATTRLWARRGARPPAPKDCRYAWTYLFGAVCPAGRIGAGLVLPYVGLEAMHHHLDEISSQVAPGAHAVLVLDGAGWQQTGGRLVVPDNLTLLHLPPYSPEPSGQCPKAGRERLGLPAGQPPRQPRVRHLQGHRRCLRHRLAQLRQRP